MTKTHSVVSTVSSKCPLITKRSLRSVVDKGRSWPLFEWSCLGRQAQETADHLPVQRLVPSQMGVITLCLAPNSLVGGGGEGARPRTSRTWPGNAEMRLESACDNGYRGDLANGPQLMSPSTHLFLSPPWVTWVYKMSSQSNRARMLVQCLILHTSPFIV